MKDRIWTISNALSISRIFLVIPAAFVLSASFQFHREIAVLILLFATLTDALDGYFARKFDEITDFGKIIDPLADKIGLAIIIIILVRSGDISLWFTIIVILRDLIIFFAGLYLKSKVNIILPSTMEGKIAVSFLALYVVLSILKYSYLSSITIFLEWMTLLILAYSIFVYAKRFHRTLDQFQKRIN